MFGGENEHRTYLSDVVIFDLKTAHWIQPTVHGPIPKGRARHAAALYKDKLFVVGGVTGYNNCVLNDVCYLDLKTWTWSRSWTFVRRFDHAAWVWGEKLWVFGGLGQELGRGGEIWWLDLKVNLALDSAPAIGITNRIMDAERVNTTSRPWTQITPEPAAGLRPYMGNSAGVPANASSSIRPSQAPTAPGVSSLSFVSSPDCPPQASGTHFYVYSSDMLLDFVTPASTIRPTECGLAALDLPTLRWQSLAEGAEVFSPGYRWHYCALDEDGTKAWLLGCATDIHNGHESIFEEYLCDVLPIDLRRFGLLGNASTSQSRIKSGDEANSDSYVHSPLSGLGADLAAMFDRSPESGSGADFIVTAEPDDSERIDEEEMVQPSPSQASQQAQYIALDATTSAPIHVHRLILQARWPHFGRLYTAQMVEFHSKKMHIPEPYSVVRAFLYYLYSNSIAPHPVYCDRLELSEVAGLLVMANVYDLPGLRHLCVHRLGKELDIDHAAIIWERAGTANEDWLRRRAATFCLKHWGRVVRTDGFRRLSRQGLMELCEEVDTEGRVVGGRDLDAAGGMNGAVFDGAGGWGKAQSRLRGVVNGNQARNELEDTDEDEEEMDIN